MEEGYPVVEEQLKGFLGLTIPVHGRLDGTLQRDGELTPDAVGKALGKDITSYYAQPEVVEQRPPALCQGCGHRDMYEALNEVLAEYKAPKFWRYRLHTLSFASVPCNRHMYRHRYRGIHYNGKRRFGCRSLILLYL